MIFLPEILFNNLTLKICFQKDLKFILKIFNLKKKPFMLQKHEIMETSWNLFFIVDHNIIFG